MKALARVKGLMSATIAFVSLALLGGACGFVEPGPSISVESEAPATDLGEISEVDERSVTAVEILKVVDGDSLEVAIDGVKTKVRLEGFNAPELYVDGGDEADTKTCNGLAAKAALQEIVDSSNDIGLVAGEQDRYGRTLGDIVVGGQAAVPQLLAGGHGLATGTGSAENDSLMFGAAEGRLGIWGPSCGQPNSDTLRIGDAQVDPAGNDRSNLVDEWVEIDNVGSERIDLDGWTIRDDTTGHQFVLNGVLEAGATLRIRSGQGKSSSQDVYLGESYPVWSNDGETVILVDPNGVFSHWRFIK